MFMRQCKQRGLEVKRDQVLDMFFWAIIGLLVGARAAAVTIYDPTGYYLRHPLQIILPFAMVDGRLRMTGISGMSYHGGLVGTIIAIVTYLKVKRLDVLDWGDMLVTGIPLGYTFGRLGNFINGELYGRATGVPWGMIFPDAEKFNAKLPWVREFASPIGMSVPAAGLVNFPRHPSQLYEALFEGFVLWIVMWFILRPRRPFKGFQIACYLMGYGIIRFIIEYVREPDIGIGWPITLVPLENPVVQFSPFNLSTGQILCFLMVVAGIVCLFAFRARARRGEARAAAEAAPKPSSRRLRQKVK
jgi:phosphatidylglycerol:prolipoprotein diacylglycerol transferase